MAQARRAAGGAARSPVFDLSFPATPHRVRQALRRAVARFARQIGPENAGTLELVLAEVLNNIVEHAYSGRAEGGIVMRIVLGSDGLRCILCDSGLPMPERRIPQGAGPSVAGGLAALPEGGFGWSLIRQLVASPRYRRDGGTNILRFVLPLTG